MRYMLCRKLKAMAEVKAGNQVFSPSDLCARLNTVAAILFKPHG